MPPPHRDAGLAAPPAGVLRRRHGGYGIGMGSFPRRPPAAAHPVLAGMVGIASPHIA